jgi:hypothetical protein
MLFSCRTYKVIVGRAKHFLSTGQMKVICPGEHLTSNNEKMEAVFEEDKEFVFNPLSRPHQ